MQPKKSKHISAAQAFDAAWADFDKRHPVEFPAGDGWKSPAELAAKWKINECAANTRAFRFFKSGEFERGRWPTPNGRPSYYYRPKIK